CPTWPGDIVEQVLEAHVGCAGSTDRGGRHGLVLAFANVDQSPSGGGGGAVRAQQIGREPRVGSVAGRAGGAVFDEAARPLKRVRVGGVPGPSDEHGPIIDLEKGGLLV